MINLFNSTKSLTNRKEDHLTEFFATVLCYNKDIRNAYASIILNDYAAHNGWKKPEITDIQTQVSFESSVPDMRLKLSDGHIIICEHKLSANEQKGSPEDSRSQLERYLELPIDGLVYVRSNQGQPPNPKVLNHPKYIAPANRTHFIWQDFYEILKQSEMPIVQWLRSGFEDYEFTPPFDFDPSTLSDSDKEIEKRKRTNLAKLWEKTISYAQDLGWKVTRGSIVQLYLSGGSSQIVSKVFICPAYPKRFLIRLTPAVNDINSIMTILPSQESIGVPFKAYRNKACGRADGDIDVIDITTTLHNVTGKAEDASTIEDCLFRYVAAFLNAIS